MDRTDTEKLVQIAVGAGLVGSENRRMLLDGLPLGFTYSLPTVSRPVDQLRFDLMELSRTPRLIGLDEPPLAVWLDNAAQLLDGRNRPGGEELRAQARALRGDPAPEPEPAVSRSADRSTRYDFYVACPDDLEARAEPLVLALRAAGCTVFFKPDSLDPGDYWDRVSPEALADSEMVLVVMPERPGKGDYFLREDVARAIDLARVDRRRVVPAYLSRSKPIADVPYGLRRISPLHVSREPTVGHAARRLAELLKRAGPAAAQPDASDEDRTTEDAQRDGPVADAVEPTPQTTMPTAPGVGERASAGQLLGGRFRLEALIGQGPVTATWKALDTTSGEPVAVKLLHPELAGDPVLRSRFGEAVTGTYGLNVPGVAQPLAPVGDDSGFMYAVVPFLAGGSLEVRSAEEGFTTEDARRAVQRVADALAGVHRAGLVHRALHPGNILFDADGRAWLTDVEMAVVAAGPDTVRGRQRDVFVAPEALDAPSVAQPASDRYGLALTAAHALAGGVLPRSAARAPERAIADLGVSPELAEALTRAVRYEPSERYDDTAAFAEALRQAWPAGPASADDPSPGTAESTGPRLNPFTVGRPLPKAMPPPGRQREVNRLMAQLLSGGSAVVVGPWRSGKTSLIGHVAHRLEAEGHRAEVVSVDGAELGTADALAGVLRPDLRGAEHPSAALLEELDIARSGSRPIWLIDEVAHLHRLDGLAFGWLRNLGQSRAAFGYAGRHRDWQQVCHAARDLGSPFGNDTMSIDLGPLSNDDAIAFLVDTSPADASIDVSLATDIVRFVGGWPLYLQYMGFAVVDELRHGRVSPASDPVQRRDWVRGLYEGVIIRDAADTVFRPWWSSLTTAVRAVLLGDGEAGSLLDAIADDDEEAGQRAYRALGKPERRAIRQVRLYDGTTGWSLMRDPPLLDWLRRKAFDLRDELDDELGAAGGEGGL